MTQKAARAIGSIRGARGTHAANRWALAIAVGFAIVCGGVAAAHAVAPCNDPDTVGGGALGLSPGPTSPISDRLGWDVGSGQCNGSFTTATATFAGGPIELGLRAEQRSAGNVANGGGDYTVQTGTDTTQPNPNRAWWNSDISIAYGSSIATLDSLTLTIVTRTGLAVPPSPTTDLLAIRGTIDDRHASTTPTSGFTDVYQASQSPIFGWLSSGCPTNGSPTGCAVGNCTKPFTYGMCLAEEGAWEYTLKATKGADTASTTVCFHTPGTTCCGPRYVDDSTGTDAANGSFCKDSGTPCKTIQHAVDSACAGDTVNVAAGTYNESPNINKALTLQSSGGRDVTNINLLQSSGYPYGALQIGGATAPVIVDGFTLVGADGVAPGCPPFPPLAITNVLVHATTGAVTLQNNRFKVGAEGCGSDGDDGYGILTDYADPAVTIPDLTVQDNLFVPLNASGSRAFYANPGVGNFTFRRNTITGQFDFAAVPEVQNGLVEDNTVDGLGLGGVGFRAQSFTSLAWGSTVAFQGNVITGTSRGIWIRTGNNVTVQCNRLQNNDVGIYLEDIGIFGDPTLAEIHNNSLLDNTVGVENTAAGTVDAENNWWGCAAGPPDGACDTTSGNVDSTNPATSVPACVPCSADAQCEDGNVCTTDTCSAGVNLALSGTASQSSTLTGFDVGAAPSCTGATSPPGADRANDGDTDGNYYSGCSVAVTQSEAQPWWQVDLGASQLITSIEVWNRTDVSGATTDFHVLVSDDPTFTTNVFDYHDSGTAGTPTTVSAVNATGRYVRVQLSGTDYLQLAEVKVFGGGCTSTNNTDPCDDDLFCTGADTCGGGTCSTHAGDPCTGGGECANFCDEALDTCNLPNTEPCTTDSNVCTLDFCDGAGACAHTPGNAGTECRTSAGVCDVAESCNGIDAACPTDGFQSSSIQCRAPGGACGLAENCTGSAAACPADLNKTPGTVCRASTGVCDPQEVCTGTATCPTQVLTPAGTQCRAPGGACGLAEVCDGSTGACPTDLNKAPGTVCRASTGVCDPQEVCTGTATCPTQVLSPAGTQCRAPGGACGLAEVCDGSTGACPTDLNKAPGTVCRASTGVCDPQEVCTGTATCPTQVLSPAGTECRASTAGCDPAENCTGTAATCPTDINTCP